MSDESTPCENTDREIFRKFEGDFYAPSMHVTKEGSIGINVGGHVIVLPIEVWFEAGKLCLTWCNPKCE